MLQKFLDIITNIEANRTDHTTTHCLYFDFCTNIYDTRAELLIDEMGLGNAGQELKRRSS